MEKAHIMSPFQPGGEIARKENLKTSYLINSNKQIADRICYNLQCCMIWVFIVFGFNGLQNIKDYILPSHYSYC